MAQPFFTASTERLHQHDARLPPQYLRIRMRGEEFIGCLAGAFPEIIVVHDHLATFRQSWPDEFEAELDRVVPVAVDMGERDSGALMRMDRFLEQALDEEDPLAVDGQAERGE